MRSSPGGFRLFGALAWALMAMPRTAAADIGYTDVTNGQFVGTGFSAVGWADYDRDNDLDVLITGVTGTRLYRNEGGGVFTDLGSIGLPNVSEGGLAWGDFDRDLDLDLLLTGTTDGTPSGAVLRLYDNNGSGTGGGPGPGGTDRADHQHSRRGRGHQSQPGSGPDQRGGVHGTLVRGVPPGGFQFGGLESEEYQCRGAQGGDRQVGLSRSQSV